MSTITDRERHAAAAFLNNEHDSIADAARYYDADERGVREIVEADLRNPDLDRDSRKCEHSYNSRGRCYGCGTLRPNGPAAADPFDEWAANDLRERLGVDADKAAEIVANTYDPPLGTCPRCGAEFVVVSKDGTECEVCYGDECDRCGGLVERTEDPAPNGGAVAYSTTCVDCGHVETTVSV